jgi:hypothetical protein
MRTRNLLEKIVDTKTDLPEELGLMVQVEMQAREALVEATRHEIQKQLKKSRGPGRTRSVPEDRKSRGSTSDRSGVQMLVARGESHSWSLPNRVGPPTCYTGSRKEGPMKKPLRPSRTASRTSSWPQRVPVSWNRRRILTRIFHSHRTACLPLLHYTTQVPCEGAGRQDVRRKVIRPCIKIQLLLGGDKMAKETLELQAVFLAVRPRKQAPGYSGRPSPTNRATRPRAGGVLELWEARPLPA